MRRSLPPALSEGLRVQVLGLRILDIARMVQILGLRVVDIGFRVLDVGSGKLGCEICSM